VELRTYGKILWRRVWIIALVVSVVVIYVGYQYYIAHKSSGGSTTYHSRVDIRIGLQAPPHNTNPTFTDYITTSEALADELTTGPTLTSTAFGEQVIQQIRNDAPKGNIGDWNNASTITSPSTLTATRIHSVVTIDVNWPTEAGAGAIAHAMGEVITAHIAEYLDYRISSNSIDSTGYPIAAAKVINQTGDIPTVTSTSATKTSLLLALLVVGLILGIALAFLVEYLDDRIYDSAEVGRMLQLPIYGEVPRAPISHHSQTESSSAS
jgi:capsular polysaccharide biosynthesis protein